MTACLCLTLMLAGVSTVLGSRQLISGSGVSDGKAVLAAWKGTIAPVVSTRRAARPRSAHVARSTRKEPVVTATGATAAGGDIPAGGDGDTPQPPGSTTPAVEPTAAAPGTALAGAPTRAVAGSAVRTAATEP